MHNVFWTKDTAKQWLKLETFDISLVSTSDIGVYVIWHAGAPSRVVKVGQGIIYDRLGCHRQDSAITAHRKYGTLYVTWAIVRAAQSMVSSDILGIIISH